MLSMYGFLSIILLPMGGVSIGRHTLVSRFMQGSRRLRPFRPWDLAIIQECLAGYPFEPLVSVSVLVALSSLKKIEDLQNLSVSPSCMDFPPGLDKVLLRPRPGYIPKFGLTPFGFQQVVFEAFPPADSGTGSDVRPLSLYPVRKLKIYVDHTVQWRRSDQMFVSFGGKNKKAAVTEQRMSHWVIKAISLSIYFCCGRMIRTPLSGCIVWT